MSSATTAVAVQCRLKEWAGQIRECQNRPAGMGVVDWCASHGITKADYYYRLRRVRQACLGNLPPGARRSRLPRQTPAPYSRKHKAAAVYSRGFPFL